MKICAKKDFSFSSQDLKFAPLLTIVERCDSIKSEVLGLSSFEKTEARDRQTDTDGVQHLMWPPDEGPVK